MVQLQVIKQQQVVLTFTVHQTWRHHQEQDTTTAETFCWLLIASRAYRVCMLVMPNLTVVYLVATAQPWICWASHHWGDVRVWYHHKVSWVSHTSTCVIVDFCTMGASPNTWHAGWTYTLTTLLTTAAQIPLTTDSEVDTEDTQPSRRYIRYKTERQRELGEWTAKIISLQRGSKGWERWYGC